MTLLELLAEAWPDEISPPVIRFRDAIEETYAAAHAIGLDADELYAAQAPFSQRCDAWLWRTSKLLSKSS